MTINDIKAMLPEDECAKLPKFYSVVDVLIKNEENTQEILKTYVENDCKITTILDLRGFMHLSHVLKSRLDIYKATPYFQIVQNNTRVLSYNPEIIIGRLDKCAAVGKGYLDNDGRICDFITDNELWQQVDLGLHSANELPSTDFEDVFADEVNATVSALLNQGDSFNYDAPFDNVESGMRR